MSDTLHAISRSLAADVDALATISHNVANMTTPGYRSVRAIPDFEVASGLRTVIEQRDGALAQTERAFDLALRGKGFFVVERGGQLLLTRGGNFRVDAEGALTTAAGDRVQGTSGTLLLPAGELRIDARGELWLGMRSVGQLQLVDVADPARLRPAGNGSYAYDGQVAAFEGELIQGALEQANVDPADETVRLMELTRHAESVQRAMSIYHQAMDAGINRLGDN